MRPRPPRASAILRMIRSLWQRSRLRRRHPGNDLLHPAPRGSRPGPRSSGPPGTPPSTRHPAPARPGPDAAQMWQWAREGNSQQLLRRCREAGGRVSGMERLGVSPRMAGTAGTRGQRCPRGHTPATRSCRGTAGTNPGVRRGGGATVSPPARPCPHSLSPHHHQRVPRGW